MKITYDKKADAIYIYLSNKPVSYTKEIDADRIIDYSADDEPRGIELLGVSHGVTTDDLPQRVEVERLLETRGIKAYA